MIYYSYCRNCWERWVYLMFLETCPKCESLKIVDVTKVIKFKYGWQRDKHRVVNK